MSNDNVNPRGAHLACSVEFYTATLESAYPLPPHNLIALLALRDGAGAGPCYAGAQAALYRAPGTHRAACATALTSGYREPSLCAASPSLRCQPHNLRSPPILCRHYSLSSVQSIIHQPYDPKSGNVTPLTSLGSCRHKKAAKQAAAEQAEVKAKRAVAVADKATEEEATKELVEQMMSAEEATPAKATKE